MQSFTKHYTISAPIAKVWEALTDAETIDQWGGGPDVVMSAENDTEFELWGGDIWGTNIEVVPTTKLVQEWFGGDWDEPSIVSFTLSEKKGKTHVELEHRNLPDDEAESFEQGWDDEYMGPLQEFVENEE